MNRRQPNKSILDKYQSPEDAAEWQAFLAKTGELPRTAAGNRARRTLEEAVADVVKMVGRERAPAIILRVANMLRKGHPVEAPIRSDQWDAESIEVFRRLVPPKSDIH